MTSSPGRVGKIALISQAEAGMSISSDIQTPFHFTRSSLNGFDFVVDLF
jgi:hypothetical protein